MIPGEALASTSRPATVAKARKRAAAAPWKRRARTRWAAGTTSSGLRTPPVSQAAPSARPQLDDQVRATGANGPRAARASARLRRERAARAATATKASQALPPAVEAAAGDDGEHGGDEDAGADPRPHHVALRLVVLQLVSPSGRRRSPRASARR
jgi:hypothetical protein